MLSDVFRLNLFIEVLGKIKDLLEVFSKRGLALSLSLLFLFELVDLFLSNVQILF